MILPLETNLNHIAWVLWIQEETVAGTTAQTVWEMFLVINWMNAKLGTEHIKEGQK